VTIPDLKQNPQDISNFYLQHIYLVVAESNTSSIPSTVAQPPAFSASWRAICVNLLWICSLAIAVICAVMATILQQWARKFLRITQAPQPDPRKRARIRVLFSGSTDMLFIKCLGYLVPCYLHLSVIVFFIGLHIYLVDINIEIFSVTLFITGQCLVVYAFFTILPFIMRDSLLFTPLSAFPVAYVGTVICFFTTMLGSRFNANPSKLIDRSFAYVERTRTAIDPVEKLPLSKLHFDILEESIHSLKEDNAVEKFFRAIPDFFSNPSESPCVTTQFKTKFEQIRDDFLDLTQRSMMVAESVKSSRRRICQDASRAIGSDVPP
jgi:hypothetical protein